MSAMIQGLVWCFEKNLEYGPKLVADLDEAQMVLQPAENAEAPSNHPAWVLSHLNAYLPILAAVIEGKEFEDPKQHRFGMLSKPEADRSIYASKDSLISEFVDGHNRAIEMLESATADVMEQSIQLPRWAEVMPKAGIALQYLMLNHENMHLGQISAWRRIQGMPSV